MKPVVWEAVEDVEPVSGPPCGVHPGGHTWELSIQQGEICLTSGCEECDDAVLGPIGIDVLEVRPIAGRLAFEREHPEGQCPYMFDICDHGYWWTFVPDDGGEEP